MEVLAGLFPLTPVPVGRLAGAVGLLGVPFPTRAGVGDLVVRLADGRVDRFVAGDAELEDGGKFGFGRCLSFHTLYHRFCDL